jgi:hypothetical protein
MQTALGTSAKEGVAIKLFNVSERNALRLNKT